VRRRLHIGEMLVGQGRIDAAQLTTALAHQKQWGGRLGRALVTLGFVSEPVLFSALGEQLGVPFVEIGNRYIPPEVIRLVPEKLVRQLRVFPLMTMAETRHQVLVVAVSDPGNLPHLDEIAFAAGMKVRAALASEADIDRAIARYLDGASGLQEMTPIELPDEPEGRMELVERPRTGKYYH
jgi:hypothetical protein